MDPNQEQFIKAPTLNAGNSFKTTKINFISESSKIKKEEVLSRILGFSTHKYCSKFILFSDAGGTFF